MARVAKATEEVAVEVKPISEDKVTTSEGGENGLISCLTNERIIVRYINRQSMIKNPKHVLYGGMAENATITFSVPRLASSGAYVNVLTNQEKNFLEYALGLQPNALSVYKSENNFWDDSNPSGINKVSLSKQDNYFDLKDPKDYIKYKILLANKNSIAPSLQELQDRPKATYRFVIIRESEENRVAKQGLNTTMACYKEFGKIEEDKWKLRTIVELITGRGIADSTKLDQLQVKINELIQSDAKTFLRTVTDEFLNTKVLIKKAINCNVISNRNNLLYYTKDGSPLCELGEESTMNIAARYLTNPRHSELRFAIEEAVKE